MASTTPVSKHFSARFIFALSLSVLAALLILINLWFTPTSLLPPFPKSKPDPNPANHLILFSEHDEYENLSHSHDALWDSLLPQTGGFVLRLDENGTQHKYGISMYHSLHCLIMMRSAIQGLYREIERLNGGENMAGDHDHGEHGDPTHWLHCFDYLRQIILCAADGTIEPPRTNPEGKENVDGMIERKCRDPALLWKLSVDSYEVEKRLRD
ncbi:Tat pathway signal sequence protein [Rutstroemia sp. NJR-2017a BBW]|nr:Tat pathway signal sequence protein [Rutstroemia sp. NJR-2017a BBW]